MNHCKLVFTRYLYIKEEVKLSLIFAILNKKEEAVFWAYELYYSGFKKELTDLFWSIYYDFYATLNVEFEKYLLNKLEKTLEITNDEKRIAAIVNNFMIRPHNMDVFMIRQIVNNFELAENINTCEPHLLISLLEQEDFVMLGYFILEIVDEISIEKVYINVITFFENKGVNINKNMLLKTFSKTQNILRKRIVLSKIIHYYVLMKNKIIGKNLYVETDPAEVIMYETINDISIKSYKILPMALLYFIDEEDYLSLFKLSRGLNITNEYHYNWLYYASFTPLWSERILKYNGIIDHTKKSVEFENDNLELFYNCFGYEPDEQKKQIQDKNIQKINKKRDWFSFYYKHNENSIISIDEYLTSLEEVSY